MSADRQVSGDGDDADTDGLGDLVEALACEEAAATHARVLHPSLLDFIAEDAGLD